MNKPKQKKGKKKGERKEIGKKKEKDGFWLTQENKKNLFGQKWFSKLIYTPGSCSMSKASLTLFPKRCSITPMVFRVSRDSGSPYKII